MVTNKRSFPGIVVTDHLYELPLDYAEPLGRRIKVFGREVVDKKKADADLHWLVFLQGGPGGWSPRPSGKDIWLKQALEHYRVFLLDQRGVGPSGGVSFENLKGAPEEQAEYLSHLRADNIVRDCEAIRQELVGKKWTSLGQSYGGFCTLTYLSHAPEGLEGAMITGGVPGIGTTAEELFRITYPKVKEKNQKFYERHPEDRETIARVVREIKTGDYTLPCGDPLTLNRFRQLGSRFGMKDGFDTLHYILELAFMYGDKLSHAFLKRIEDETSYPTGPIYAIIHEAIYCEGTASNWAADRVRTEFPEFMSDDGEDLLFIGEMPGRWMFDEIGTLKPLAKAADLLAAKSDWAPLYDPGQLAKNEVPTVCAVYHDDMYVPVELSKQTIDATPNMRGWITNEFEHCGLRTASDKVLTRLIGMLHGEID